MYINKYIDHTLLKPTATHNDILKLCVEAQKFGFYAVCINGCNVPLAKIYLKDSPVKIAAVVGFPLGAGTTAVKVLEAEECIKNGADEIDMVINLGWIKSGDFEKAGNEISAVKNAIGNRILKVIIETCYLDVPEKEGACRTALKAKADFVKTSTGFGPAGATLEDVKLMKKVVGDQLKIKASGGIKDRKTAIKFIKAGADRIGTSSGITLLPNSEDL